MTDKEPAGAEPEEAHDHTAELATLVEDGQLNAALELARSLHPAELANVLAGVDTDVRDLLIPELPPDELGAALSYLEPHYRDDLLIGLSPTDIAAVLTTVPDDVATDVVQELPHDIGQAVLEAVPDALQQDIGDLLEHRDETAGGRMTGQRVAVPPDQRVSQVIEYLRTIQPDAHQPFYVYVTGEQDELLGVLNLRSLITAPPDTPVSELAVTDVLSVRADTDQEEAARLLKRYKLLSLPVVDAGDRLVGTVTADDLLDVLEDEATEDMFRIVGVDEDEDLRSVWRSVRFRLPWLSVNLVTVLVAGFVVSMFEGTLARVAVLAAFLPVIAGQGGNAGIQTLTVVVRSLALGRLTTRNTTRIVGHELAVGAITGLTLGAAVALLTFGWQGNGILGLIVGVALLANTLVGVLAGVLIPMGLQRLRQDPALSGGIWLTTTTDVLGLLGFLGLAALLISQIE